MPVVRAQPGRRSSTKVARVARRRLRSRDVTSAGAEVSPRSGQHRADYVYAKLREAIHSGRLRPGDRVPEIELARWLSVSRTPIRDALRRLESAGLVSHAPQGLIVTSLDPQQILELYALREILEGAAAAFAARYASESEIRSLQDLIARQKAAGNNAKELADLNRQFHELVYHAGRNRYLIQALRGLRDSLAILPGTTYSVAGRPAQALAEHTKIVDAIRRQNATGAEDGAKRHIRFAANARLSMVIGPEPRILASARP